MTTIERLAKFDYEDSDEKQKLIDALYKEVEPLCKTDTDGLEDWLYNGVYQIDHTPEGLAEEWDSYSEQ